MKEIGDMKVETEQDVIKLLKTYQYELSPRAFTSIKAQIKILY